METLGNQIFNRMSLKEKIGQLFMVSISGTTLTQATQSLIKDSSIGGIVIMSSNITSSSQLKQFIPTLQDSTKIKLLIATDQEGGVVVRIPWDEARFVSEPHIGIVDREDFAYQTGDAHAKALKEYDINMNLAPVLDTSFIAWGAMSSRTIATDPDKVTRLGVQIIKAHQNENIISTAKHFPGIGRTTTDSHQLLPQINITKKQLLNEELLPFKGAIKENIPVIMVGHVLYPQIDKKYPASLSKTIISEILREELQYTGVVITDDLRMGALDAYPDKGIDALNAGADMLLLVDSTENEQTMIEKVYKAVQEKKISQERIDKSVKRILSLKLSYELM